MGLLNSGLGTSFSPSNTVLVSRFSFVNYCVFTKQTFSCDSAALDFLTNFNFSTLTIGFNNCLSVAGIREIEDMLLKGI